MKNYLKLTLIALLLLSSQTVVIAQPDSVWSRIYGWRSNDFGQSVVACPDGGYLIGGRSSEYNSQINQYDTTQSFLLRITEQGDSLWTILSPISYGASVGSLRNDGRGFLSLGGLVPTEGDPSILIIKKLDEYGATVWERTVGIDSTSVSGTKAFQKENGNYMIFGSTRRYYIDPQRIERDLFVMEFNSDGDSLRTLFIEGDEAERCSDVIATADGGYLLVGSVTETENIHQSRPYLQRLSDRLNIVWSVTFEGEDQEWASDAVEIEDGFLVTCSKFSGLSMQQSYLLRIDHDGDTIWRKQLGGDWKTNGYQLIVDKDSNIWVLGACDFDNQNNYSPWLMKANPDGELIWQKHYGENTMGWFSDYAMSPEGGLLLVGTTGNVINRNANQAIFTFKIGPLTQSITDANLSPHPRLLFLSSFPSPFNSSTLVTFSSPYSDEARVSLMDVNGRLVSRWIPASAGMRGSNGQFVVDGAGLSAGIYWLKVEQSGQSASTRLVLVK